MAEPLSFGRELDDEQREVAKKIIERATALGIDPRLAVSVAYQESRLRPGVGRSPKGAVGIMQVMPKTGKEFGFSMEDLQNPDTNIDAGLTVLKSYLSKFPDDPRLGVVAYNAGPNHAFFEGGELPKETQGYLKDLMGFGAFSTVKAAEPSQEPPQEPAETQAEEPAQPAMPDLEAQRIQKDMDAQEVRQAQLYGGGAGAALGAVRGAGDIGGGLVEAMARRKELGKMAAQATKPVPPPPLGGAPAPIGAPQTPPLTGAPQMPPQPAVDISGRPPGTAVQNYAKAVGLGEIEAGRALDMTKQPGGVHDLTTKRREALGKLEGMAPARGMTEDLTRGGLMVPQQTPYTGPRGPQGEIGGGKPPPVAPIAPRPPGTLERVTSLLRTLANTPLVRYGLPILGGATAAGEAARAKQMYEQGDPVGAALSGATALGGAMSMFPYTAPFGIPLSLGAGALQYGRELMDQPRNQPVPPTGNPMGNLGF